MRKISKPLGRPRIGGEDKEVVSVRMALRLIKKLDAAAKKSGLSRSEFIWGLVEKL